MKKNLAIILASITFLNTGFTVYASEEDLDTVVSNMEIAAEELTTELEKLGEEITTYSDFVEKHDKVEAYYANVLNTTRQLCITIEEEAIAYTEALLASGKDTDDIYEDMENVSDYLYEDARDVLSDDIYDDLTDDISDMFYDGVIDDAEDTMEYEDWYDARSDEYDIEYDLRSDLYDIIYDCGSDLYDFVYDIRVELWDGDIERATKKLEKFKEDVADEKEDLEDDIAEAEVSSTNEPID